MPKENGSSSKHEEHAKFSAEYSRALRHYNDAVTDFHEGGGEAAPRAVIAWHASLADFHTATATYHLALSQWHAQQLADSTTGTTDQPPAPADDHEPDAQQPPA